MIKIIAGEKGTGKTARLVDDINTVAAQDNNVVCIERGNRLDQLLKPNVRLINMKEYPCSGYDQLLAFIGGICSKDYDLTHIYIDSIYKVAKDEDSANLAEFIDKLDAFLKDTPITATLILSGKLDELPESVKVFC
ncbi:MAG: twitching motility protein PilT [Clostridiales bacterium]|nr:twitching motility protein PilT [Clostridiales bacterium]HAW16404.1 twitching motility protein PilT [Clostridiales bacterium]